LFEGSTEPTLAVLHARAESAALPYHTGVSRTRARQVKRLKAGLATAFYLRYLLRTCEKLQAEGFPSDILDFPVR